MKIYSGSGGAGITELGADWRGTIPEHAYMLGGELPLDLKSSATECFTALFRSCLTVYSRSSFSSTMSQTTTLTQTRVRRDENPLKDYTLHVTGKTQTELSAAQREEIARQECLRAPNPTSWPTNYRRVPHYRPINRFLDPAQRPNGANTGEYIFVNVMLNGVRIQSVCAQQNY